MQHRSRGAIAAWAKPLTSETTTPSVPAAATICCIQPSRFASDKAKRDLRGGPHPDRSRSHGRRGARIIEASLRFRPTVFVIMSSPLMIALEEYFEQSNIDPREVFKSYKVVIFGGEALGPRQRALARSWGIELYEMMALGDVSIAMECEMHDGCHPNEDLALVECLDPNGSTPVADGEVGELVVTMLGESAIAADSLSDRRSDDRQS